MSEVYAAVLHIRSEGAHFPWSDESFDDFIVALSRRIVKNRLYDRESRDMKAAMDEDADGNPAVAASASAARVREGFHDGVLVSSELPA